MTKLTILDDLNRMTDLIRDLQKEVRFERFITPQNYQQEEEKFLAAVACDEIYNPQFEYERPDGSILNKIATVYNQAQLTRSYWDHLIAQDLSNQWNFVDAIIKQDSHALIQASRQAYGPVNSDTITAAEAELNKSLPKDTPSKLTSVQAKLAFESILRKLGLSEWSVEVEPTMSARMSVNSAELRIRIKADALFNLDTLRRLAIHEIGIHVIRSENGRRQPLRLLGLGLADYLSTEEGLAAWAEKSAFGPGPSQTRFAIRYLAVAIAATKGFYETALAISSYVDPAQAFMITARVKRGLFDTSQVGGYLKDHAYFQGFQQIDQFMGNNPSSLSNLMMGKLSLRSLQQISSLIEAGWAYPILDDSFSLDKLRNLVEASIPQD